MKRFLIAAGMGAVLAFLAAAPASAGVNLLANPGFETGGGSYTGWFKFGSGPNLSLPTPGDNIFRSGTAASKTFGEFTGCPGTPGYRVGGFGQAFTPTSGRVYELSGYSFVSGADPIPGTDTCNRNRMIAKIVFFNMASGGSEISASEVVIGDYSTPINKWHHFTVSAPVPAGALRVEALFLFLQPGCDPGAVYLDDVNFCETLPASLPNVLANPSFSGGLSGWSTFGNVFYDARNFTVRTPAGSAKLFSTFVADAPSGLFQSFAAAPGSAWRMDAHALVTCREDPIAGTNDNYAVARIVFRNGIGDEVGSVETVVADNKAPLGKWAHHATQGIAPAGTATVEAFILFISPTLMGGAVWVDDLSFRSVDPTAAPITTPPVAFRLGQNSPNPFSPSTRIEFSLDGADDVRLSVFDVAGRRVATLLDGRMDGGSHSVLWNGETDAGSRAAAGIYRYVMTTSGGRLSRTMVLVD